MKNLALVTLMIFLILLVNAVAAPESICVATPVDGPPVGGSQQLRNISFELIGWWDFLDSDALIWCGEAPEPPTGSCVLFHGNDEAEATGWTHQGFSMEGYDGDLWVGVKAAIFSGAGADLYDDVAYISLWRSDGVSLCTVMTTYNGDQANYQTLWHEHWFKVTLIDGQEWPEDMGIMFSSLINSGSDFTWDDIVVIRAPEQHTVFIPLVLMGAQ